MELISAGMFNLVTLTCANNAQRIVESSLGKVIALAFVAFEILHLLVYKDWEMKHPEDSYPPRFWMLYSLIIAIGVCPYVSAPSL